MSKRNLTKRLKTAHPGWKEWDELLDLVSQLKFERVEDEFLGNHLVSGGRLTFAADFGDVVFPEWMPPYVPALLGMKADDWEMSGGYAQAFDGRTAVKGQLFSPAGNDAQLGFPVFEVPKDVYPFQYTHSGGTVFINKKLQILFPDAEERKMARLDDLPAFTKNSIAQTVAGRPWTAAYGALSGKLLD
jgi:hypothetical protein